MRLSEIKATEKKVNPLSTIRAFDVQEAETLNDAVADDSFDVAAVSKQLMI